MPYSPALDSPVSRVRFAVGDVATVELLPDATYTALLTQLVTEIKAAQAAAAFLAVKYAQDPSSLSSSGKSLAWSERVAQWNRIAGGEIPAGIAAVLGARVGKGFHIPRGPQRDYTTGEGDANGA